MTCGQCWKLLQFNHRNKNTCMHVIGSCLLKSRVFQWRSTQTSSASSECGDIWAGSLVSHVDRFQQWLAAHVHNQVRLWLLLINAHLVMLTCNCRRIPIRASGPNVLRLRREEAETRPHAKKKKRPVKLQCCSVVNASIGPLQEWWVARI